jgi:hypothetical protein
MRVRYEQDGAAASSIASIRRMIGQWAARPDVRAALVATIGLRVLCSALAAIPFLLGFAPQHSSSPFDFFTQPWDRWDTPNYTGIALHGYATFGLTFFMPLYPLLIRVATPLAAGNAVGAALVVSTVAAFFALLALYRLAERLYPNGNLGPQTLLVAIVLPMSFIFMAGYTESLFLALSLWAILAALDRRWWRAAVLGGLAALTRQQGLLLAALAAPDAWNWLRGTRQRLLYTRVPGALRSKASVQPISGALVAASAPILAYGGWIAFLRLMLHAPLPWDLLNAPGAWQLRYTWPGSGVLADVGLLIHPTPELTGMLGGAALDASTSLAAIAALVLATRRLPPVLLLYLVAMWCSAQIKVLPNGLTTAEGRYMLELLPLCVVPAGWLARGGPVRRIAWLAGGTIALTIYLWAFVLGGWVP